MSGQKIIEGLNDVLEGRIDRTTHMRVWREGSCPYCQGTGKQMRCEIVEREEAERPAEYPEFPYQDHT